MFDKAWSYEYEKNKEVAPGKLLLSEPFMMDENFSRTVVLICEHDNENGTLGLILNRPLKVRLNELVSSLPAFEGNVFLGGPVATDTMQFLHKLGEKIEGSVKITDGIYWGGNFEQIKILIQNRNIHPGQIAFYVGYSGWGPGQLQRELEENSWIISDARAEYVFNYSDQIWKNILKSMGGIYQAIASYPQNPILN
ncbi:MAG: YqgE/AlgH family protein [Chitinophagales bacterium]|nr:YqgE/AlgH family protein [Chitinophagales bacterium]MDW8274001.1 YqgE/AlgH family protein [Chitinophagales bacterium]